MKTVRRTSGACVRALVYVCVCVCVYIILLSYAHCCLEWRGGPAGWGVRGKEPAGERETWGCAPCVEQGDLVVCVRLGLSGRRGEGERWTAQMVFLEKNNNIIYIYIYMSVCVCVWNTRASYYYYYRLLPVFARPIIMTYRSVDRPCADRRRLDDCCNGVKYAGVRA